jgi:hypothetical protein
MMGKGFAAAFSLASVLFDVQSGSYDKFTQRMASRRRAASWIKESQICGMDRSGRQAHTTSIEKNVA